QIRKWWRVNPDYNVALPTGHAFEVFDVDGPEGVIGLGRYKDTGGFPTPLALVLTPGAGTTTCPLWGRRTPPAYSPRSTTGAPAGTSSHPRPEHQTAPTGGPHHPERRGSDSFHLRPVR